MSPSNPGQVRDPLASEERMLQSGLGSGQPFSLRSAASLGSAVRQGWVPPAQHHRGVRGSPRSRGKEPPPPGPGSTLTAFQRGNPVAASRTHTSQAAVRAGQVPSGGQRGEPGAVGRAAGTHGAPRAGPEHQHQPSMKTRCEPRAGFCFQPSLLLFSSLALPSTAGVVSPLVAPSPRVGGIPSGCTIRSAHTSLVQGSNWRFLFNPME